MTGEAIATVEQADQAFALGRIEEAARIYPALLGADPEDLYLWLRAAALVGRLGDPESAARHLEHVGERLARSGDMLLALAAAAELAMHDEEAAKRGARLVASIFCKGSERVAERRASVPPPLPRPAVGVRPATDARDRVVLRELCLDACEKAAERWQGGARSAPKKVPFYPLLSDLTADEIVAIEPSMELLARPAGDVVIKQGEEGSSIFLLARGALDVSQIVADGSAMHLAVLRAGSFFGEMALLTDSPRAAQVTCREPALLFEIRRAALEELAARNPGVAEVLARYTRQRLLRNLMSTSPLFQPLDGPRRSSLMELFESVVLEPGDVVVTEGQASEHLNVVLSGQVAVTRRDGDEILSLAELGPGQIFGEISLIKERPAGATVTARRRSVLLCLSRTSFNRHVAEYPEALAHIYKIAVDREETNLQLQRADTLDVGEDLLI